MTCSLTHSYPVNYFSETMTDRVFGGIEGGGTHSTAMLFRWASILICVLFVWIYKTSMKIDFFCENLE